MGFRCEIVIKKNNQVFVVRVLRTYVLFLPKTKGRLYVFEHYLGFHGSFFSNKIALACRMTQITEPKIVKKTLFMKSDLLDLQGYFLFFPLFEIFREADYFCSPGSVFRDFGDDLVSFFLLSLFFFLFFLLFAFFTFWSDHSPFP